MVGRWRATLARLRGWLAAPCAGGPQIHHEFQEVVDELISSFLEEIGVSAEQFASTVADNVSNEKLNSFVLNSILTVEDFVQFKAMMVKRNLDLTNQVLAMMEEQQLEEVIAKQKNWEEEIRKLDGMTDDDMLQEVQSPHPPLITCRTYCMAS